MPKRLSRAKNRSRKIHSGESFKGRKQLVRCRFCNALNSPNAVYCFKCGNLVVSEKL